MRVVDGKPLGAAPVGQRWDPGETPLGGSESLIMGILTLTCVPGSRVGAPVPWKGQRFVPSLEARLTIRTKVTCGTDLERLVMRRSRVCEERSYREYGADWEALGRISSDG